MSCILMAGIAVWSSTDANKVAITAVPGLLQALVNCVAVEATCMGSAAWTLRLLSDTGACGARVVAVVFVGCRWGCGGVRHVHSWSKAQGFFADC